MIIGYSRVSTSKQNLANQQDEIRRFADSRNLSIDTWVTEVVSGKKKGCDRKLGGLLRRMKRGDTLIVTEVSRLSRTLTDIMAIMGKCLEKGINLYTTKEGYSFDNTINSTKMRLLEENRRIIIGLLKRDCSVGDICKRFGTSRDTFAKFRNQYKDVRKALDEKEYRRKERAQRRRNNRPL